MERDAEASGSRGAGIDGARAAVLTSRFDGVVRSMANTLLRTSRSGIMNTAHDFSCCVLTTDPALLAMAQSLPIHVMSGPDISADVMTKYHPTLRRGDAFLHNSPYEGNSHAADHAVLVPVVDDDGRHRFTVYSKGHMADCGNALPTTYSAAARDVYEEGALIFPMVRVQDGYRDCEDILRMCRARIRAPEQWWGDHLALLGAARIGERMLLALAEEVGWDALDAYAEHWFAYSERVMAGALSRLPAGEIEAHTAHDPFPGAPNGVDLRATVRTLPDEGRVEIDLRENPDCLPNGLNLTEATATTAAMIAVFNALPEEVPHNGGSFRRIAVFLREGCAVGIPRHPVSCSVATTGLANRIGGAVQRALAEFGEGIGMAESGVILNPAYAVISGTDPRDGAAFVNQLMLAHSGGAAGPDFDAWLPIGDHGAGGVVLLDSVEMDELQYPIVVHSRSVERDSEGAGRRRGAPGTIVEYSPLGVDIRMLYASDGSHRPSRGAAGGHDGCIAWQTLVEQDGTERTLPVYGEVSVRDGEVVRSRTPGGGGYGDPRTRAVEAVADDVREGWVSVSRAREVYGVVVDDAGAVDVAETVRLRGNGR